MICAVSRLVTDGSFAVQAYTQLGFSIWYNTWSFCEKRFLVLSHVCFKFSLENGLFPYMFFMSHVFYWCIKINAITVCEPLLDQSIHCCEPGRESRHSGDYANAISAARTSSGTRDGREVPTWDRTQMYCTADWTQNGSRSKLKLGSRSKATKNFQFPQRPLESPHISTSISLKYPRSSVIRSDPYPGVRVKCYMQNHKLRKSVLDQI